MSMTIASPEDERKSKAALGAAGAAEGVMRIRFEDLFDF